MKQVGNNMDGTAHQRSVQKVSKLLTTCVQKGLKQPSLLLLHPVLDSDLLTLCWLHVFLNVIVKPTLTKLNLTCF